MDTLDGIETAKKIREKTNTGLYSNVIIIGHSSFEMELNDQSLRSFDYLL